MVIALIALVLALGGTATAVTISSLGNSEQKQVKRIADKEIRRLARTLTVKKAAQATNAANLVRKPGDTFATKAVSDQRGDTQGLTHIGPLEVLRAGIALAVPRTLTAVATVQARGDGGGNDDISCQIHIGTISGPVQSTYITPNGSSPSTTLTVTASAPADASGQVVDVTCSQSAASATSVEARSLTVVATS